MITIRQASAGQRGYAAGQCAAGVRV